MAISDRFRKAVGRVADRATSALKDHLPATIAPGGGPREMTLQARIPNPFSDTPLFQLRVHVTAREHSQGDSFRVRAHLQTQLVMPPDLNPALPAPEASRSSNGGALLPRTRRAARGLVRRGLQTSVARRVTPYLERKFETWVDLQAATTPLDRGAHALVPEPVQQLGLGRTPVIRAGGGIDEPSIETWVGRCEGDTSGSAQVTLIQFDESSTRDGQGKRRRPLHLAASVASFYEDERRGRRRR